MFVTFEGIDGCGKSTQVRLLKEALEKKGWDVIVTREPGGTRISEMIRDMLLNAENSEMTLETELLLYAASRAQHVSQVIRPAMEGGRIVLCERFADSTLAYQGYGCDLDLDAIRLVNNVATGGLTPYLTILLDLPVEDGLKRAALKRGHSQVDRIEGRDKAFYNRVRNGYLQIASQDPERVKILDSGENSPQSLHSKILGIYLEAAIANGSLKKS